MMEISEKKANDLQLKAVNYLFSQKDFIIDVWYGPRYTSRNYI